MDNENFDASKKYPVFMYQYSGPGSQVANQWNSANDYWFMMLTQQGYIVACRWTRTGFKGADFESDSIRIKVRSGGSNRCCKSDW
jgi:dipeptidyl-peptidase-4